MTREEYADYAITTLFLRGGPMPQIMDPWARRMGTTQWGVKHANKMSNGVPQWDYLMPLGTFGRHRCNSRREAALRYCWKHGLIKRNRRRHTWTEDDLQNLRDPEDTIKP